MAKAAAKPVSGDYLIYSTITNATDYVEWKPGPANQLPTRGRHVTIKGGAGVAPKLGLVTPLGVATRVTAEEYEFLQTIPAFNSHVEGGWLTVVKAGWSMPETESVVGDMQQRDGSAPLVPNDYADAHMPKAGKVGDVTTRPRSRPLHYPPVAGNQMFR